MTHQASIRPISWFFAVLMAVQSFASVPASAAEQVPEPAYLEGRVLVRLQGGKILGVRTPGGLSIEETVEGLAATGAVEVAEPDYTYQAAARPNDPSYADQWYLDAVRLPQAWEFAKGSPTVKVAILDSGVDIRHPDLIDRIWTNPGERAGNGLDDDRNGFPDDLHGWDFVDEDADPDPEVFPGGPSEGTNHGTLVAGVIGASGNNGVGGTGVNWNVRIVPLRVLDSDGSGSTLAVVGAVRYAISAQARVINISFTGSGYSRILADALRDAYRAGIVIVAAAGNEGDTERGGNLNVRPEYPVCYRGVGNEPIVIGVASLDRAGRRSSFSSYGSDCVRISAPGEGVFTTQAYRPGVRGFEAPYGKGWSGSSLAAPIVSGVAAMLFSMHPGLGPAEVRGFLERNAVNVDAQNPGYAGHLGAGRIDAAAATLAVQEAILSGGPVIPRSVTAPTVAPRSAAHDEELFAAAATLAGRPAVSVFRGNMTPRSGFEAFGRRTSAQSSVAMADTDGDGIAEVIAGSPAGDDPIVRVFNLDGALVGHFLAFPVTARGGVTVAGADLDGDGRAEILVGSGPGTLSRVRFFTAAGKQLGEFTAFDARDRLGVRVAAVDLEHDGTDEIAVASAGARNEVRVYGSDGKQRLSFAPFDRSWSGGVELAAGDLDGDGKDEIVVGAGAGGPPRIGIFGTDGVRRGQFDAFAATLRNGVRVSLLSHEGAAGRILAGSGVGGGELRVLSIGGTIEARSTPLGTAWKGGLRIAGPRLFNRK